MSDLIKILIDQIIEVVRPQWRRLPLEDIPDEPVDAYRKGRNDMIDAIRKILGPDSCVPKRDDTNPHDKY
jgi:hypothetical protein